MLKRKKQKDIPVYLFTGLLESGKTAFIRDTLKEDEFMDGQKTLYLLCEQGEVEIAENLLIRNMVKVVTVEDRSELTEEYLTGLELKYDIDRVLFENNGMWKPEEIVDLFPENWFPAQVFGLVDGSTFQLYMGNMGAMLMDQLKMADLVVFNRMTDDSERASYRRRIKAINAKAQVLFEDEAGTLDDQFSDSVPFDINAPEIDLEDFDYGLWYVDALENADRYNGKKIRFKAQVYRGKAFADNKLVPGRFVMTCCEADTQFLGYICYVDNAKDFQNKDWVNVEATVRVEYCKDYKQKGVVLYADKPLVPAEPGERLLTFS